MKNIPVCEPFIGMQECKNVVDCLRTNWISSKGGYIEKFEKNFAHFCGVKYAVSATSGTAALHLALLALNIKNGDEVIVPTFTMAATIFSILYVGAKPVLVDCEPDTFNIDPKKAEALITNKTKAVLAVHLYGHPCEMDCLLDIARKYGIFLIEDAAEAHGAEYKGRKMGAFGIVSAFSFYANKIITTGEGGMVVTDNKKLAERCTILKDMAFSPKRRFLHFYIGYNYRMTNIQAAIGVAQLAKINELIEKRRNNALYYNKYLKGVGGITLPVERSGIKNVYWMYGILIDRSFRLKKDALREELKQKGIETRDFFIPTHRQPFFKKLGIKSNNDFPVSDDISRRGFYLPSGTGLRKSEIRYVADIVKNICSQITYKINHGR